MVLLLNYIFLLRSCHCLEGFRVFYRRSGVKNIVTEFTLLIGARFH
jgi:hypothetical protein